MTAKTPLDKMDVVALQIAQYEEDIAGRRVAILRQLQGLGDEHAVTMLNNQQDSYFTDTVRNQFRRFESDLENFDKAVTKCQAVKQLVAFLETPDGEAR